MGARSDRRRRAEGRWRGLLAGAGALLAVALAPGCDETKPPETARRAVPPLFDPGQTVSRNAVFETVAVLQEDLEQPRHPSDGQGRAWLVAGDDPPPSPAVSERARFTIEFEVGPLGIAEGGAVTLQISPFWGWDAPQLLGPQLPGYCEVEADLDGVSLVPEAPGNHLLVIRVEGRALEPGERLRIVYGAGPPGAGVDRFAEREERFWVAVDGDGDGVRAVLPDSPTVEIRPRPPTQLHLTLPTTARPGEPIRLTAALLDRVGNAGHPFEGVVVLHDVPEGLALPREIVFEAHHAGRRTIEGSALAEGLYRLRGEATGPAFDGGTDPDGRPPIVAESNPLWIRREATRVCWGDLHGHSAFSDGTGTPEDYFAYAREVAALDVAALTDHDHFGMRFLDATPEWWERIRASVAQQHEPGRFVTLLGYEWTSWLHGHRHVLYFTDEGQIFSSIDPATENPAGLWAALRGRAALTFAHHSAGSPVATNWAFAPDPELEPVTEIVSIHGSSEAIDGPLPVHRPIPGNSVRDAVAHGYRLGFIGSGDSHDGHPGLVQLGASGGSGGLAAILCEAVTREGVRAALRERRVYATNGPRIWLDVRLGGTSMGQERPADVDTPEVALTVEVVTPGPIAEVDLIRGRQVIRLAEGDGARELFVEGLVPKLEPGEALYVRVIQVDGGAAWSSPIFAARDQNSSIR